MNYKHRYQSVENVQTALVGILQHYFDKKSVQVLNNLVLFLAVALFLQLAYYSLQW